MLLTETAGDGSGGHWPRSPRRAIRILAITLITALALGWAVAHSVGRSAPAMTVPAARATAKLHELPPIYALVYTWTTADERVESAQQRLISDCMAKRGFTYRHPPAARVGDAAESPLPFGLESLQPPPRTSGSAPRDNPGAGADRYAKALYGDPGDRVTGRGARLSVSAPAHGCLADAERRLLGDGRIRWLQVRALLFEAEQDSERRLAHDPTFRATKTRWQRCVNRAGFSWSDPQQVLKSLAPDTDLRMDRGARADVRCKDEVDYLTTGYARLAALQRAVLAGEPSVAADWKALLRHQSVAADRVLGAR